MLPKYLFLLDGVTVVLRVYRLIAFVHVGSVNSILTIGSSGKIYENW